MFALRKIIENTQTNYALGIQYQVVERVTDYNSFSEIFKNEFGRSHVADSDPEADNYTRSCYAFILTQDYAPIPLYINQQNYIMTDSGCTFSNLTHK